ncbi:MAG: type II toxin-antitoxin system Phd/YefM family antitoxin [Actinomycetota bacterium]
METVPFTEAKAQLSDLVDRVDREHQRVTITKNGRPAAIIVNPDDMDALEETVEILRDVELMRSIRKSRREAAAGKRLRLKDHV